MARLVLLLGAFLLFISGTCLALDKDLVAYWTFDEAAGQTIKDATGNGHEGKLVNNPKWVDGKFGKALEFDGKTNYAEVPNAPDLAMNTNVTYTLWFKPSVTINAGNNNYRMLSKNNSYFFLFNYVNLGQLGFIVKDPDGATNHVVYSNTNEWKSGTWYHAAGTFDGKEIKIYINGILENTLAYNGKAFVSDLTLWIGADDAPSYYAGAIDELRIYKRSLNEAEVKQAMSSPGASIQPSGKAAITWGEIKL